MPKLGPRKTGSKTTFGKKSQEALKQRFMQLNQAVVKISGNFGDKFVN
jgi:hypothetical protein